MIFHCHVSFRGLLTGGFLGSWISTTINGPNGQQKRQKRPRPARSDRDISPASKDGSKIYDISTGKIQFLQPHERLILMDFVS